MKKLFYSYVILSAICTSVSGQSPTIQWSKKFGGGMNDYCNKIIATSDSNFIAIGSTESFSGDVTGHRGVNNNADLWISKISVSGNIIWSRCLGGVADESGFSIEVTSGYGFIICGLTSSNTDDVSGLHVNGGAPFGSSDIWVVKTDSIGQIQWQKCIGSNDEDEGVKVVQTSDSGYIVLGHPRSYGGDITVNYGDYDIWLAKINSVGDIQWRKTFGSYWWDEAQSLTILDDGSCLVVGGVGGTGGNFNCTDPQKGVWVIKVDASGNEVWQRCFGGSNNEEGYDIIKSNDGGFYVASNTASIDGDVGSAPNFLDNIMIQISVMLRTDLLDH